MIEVFKDIVGYEGQYQVSNLGRVKVLKNNILMKPLLKRRGYFQVALFKNKQYKYFNIHRLVALTFIPNPENKPQVNHIDGNKQNNNVNNLEWVTCSENIKHAFKIGLKESPMKGKTGFKSPCGRKVYCLELNKTFGSMAEAERITKVKYQNIYCACVGKCKTAGGYHWLYV